MERSQWLKQSVKANPEIRKTARRDGLLVLPAFSSRQSPPLAGMEVLHRKGGAVAVVLKGSSPLPAAQKLSLLQLVQNRYKNISKQNPATREADVWRLDGSGPGSITGYRIVGRSGRQLTLRPAIQLVWDGHHWLSGKATGAPVRYQLP